MALPAGLVKLNRVAVNKTMVKASASKHSAMSYVRIAKEEERFREEIRRVLEETERSNQAKDDLYWGGN